MARVVVAVGDVAGGAWGCLGDGSCRCCCWYCGCGRL